MVRRLFVKKDIQRLIADAGKNSEQAMPRSLGAFSLTMIGMGAIIGAGIFSLSGVGAAYYAGPGIIYSFIIGGILCALAGLCYGEMAAMVPVSGSAYAYSYATMGEFVAWMIGWNLVLEYAFGSVAVSTSWSGYFVSLCTKTLELPFSDVMMQMTKGPWELVTLLDGSQVRGMWNAPASIFPLLIGMLLYRGTRQSVMFNNVIVFTKLIIILSFIGLGWSVMDPMNWIANPSASGLSQLVPLESVVIRNGEEYDSFGWPGVLTGAAVVFFAYIGFDAISTTGQECKNPGRDLPIGILTSLAICTIIYILMALVITGIVPYKELGVPDPIALGIDKIVALRGWTPHAQKIFTFLIKFGALAGLASGVLVLMMSQSRIFYAMSQDGLLPWFNQLHPKYASPHISTVTTSVFVSICAGAMPMSLVGELVSIGTLLAFMVVCIGIPILRIKNPDTPRPFKVPAYWLVAPAGTLACLWVMSGLPSDTWIRLFVWLAIGLAIYFAYGIKHSKLRLKE